MSDRILGWIAIGVITGATALIYQYDLLSPVVVFSIIVLGVIIRVSAIRRARRTIISRRRMYKDYWRREEQGDISFDLPEEESIVLLGRIKSWKLSMVLMFGTAIAAFFLLSENLFWFVLLLLALGQAFLALKLLLIARNLDRVLLPDSQRDIQVELPAGSADKYIVGIDLRAVHDFIQPRAALPFWTIMKTERWLKECGFRLRKDGQWEASKEALRLLDHDEITSIEPAPISERVN